jgi:chaperonin cofactor prefoldin
MNIRTDNSAVIAALNERNAELEKEAVIAMKQHHDLCWKIEEFKQAIISNCYDDTSTAGKRLMSLALKEREL